ncbi:hypothetical protein M9H77_16087 [Catharanthus roseus]|uniref:Uncharacterized protein n=1 Tax=Catharanthus roseus TaxID=4058 RepID=A0ACC0AZB9_CATRO|nr:hypothetical protein M9H77_16087 [Catharanthus roseus]
MVGKQAIAVKTRSRKSSNLANAKITSPKKGGNPSNASASGRKGTRRKPDESEDSDIVIPSSSPEPETDYESKKEERNGKNQRATRKGADKQNGIKIKEAEASLEKKKVNGASSRVSEGNKEHKKKLDKKPKGKEVDVKSPEKLNKKDDKIKADGKKGSTGKRQNEDNQEDKRNEKRQKMKLVEVEQQSNGAKKSRDDGQKEDKNQKTKGADARKQRNGANNRQDQGSKEDKEDSKRQKKEVAEVEKQMNETKKKQNEGAKKEEQEKDEKKAKKKKNKEVEIETDDEEESNKSNNVLYKFPMNRISRIIKSADINNKIAQEAVFVINKASEKFLELFSKEAYACAFLDHKNHVAYNHLSSVVSKRRRFDFLSDFVPEKVKGEAALAEMLKAESSETET